MTFEELNLEKEILEGLYAMNFEDATPIQELSIPHILEGRDIIGYAQTGTGKTAAYVLPVINKLSKGDYPQDAINAVIMAPTRELAQQIDQQIEGFTYYVPVSTVAVYGGTDGIAYARQERGLQMGADIVVATPGRLISHLNMESVDLSRVSFFVLDEADRMLDMGFYDDIMQIYRKLPPTCQIIMFSATMPPKIRTLAQTILKNPEEIKVAIARPPETIIQSAYICHEAQKLPILKYLFEESRPQRVIIFSSSKMKVKELEATLKRYGFNVQAMHSDLEQPVRDQVMRDFKNRHIDILVATDVVARGIDINDISLIVNFDIPNDPEDYVHRIGRTARGANGEGLAITFVDIREQFKFREIERFLDRTIYKIPLDPSLGEAPAYEPDRYRSLRGRGTRPGGGGKNVRAKPGRPSSGKGRPGRRDKTR
jgi:superfamily II DNA/RNA helicase